LRDVFGSVRVAAPGSSRSRSGSSGAAPGAARSRSGSSGARSEELPGAAHPGAAPGAPGAAPGKPLLKGIGPRSRVSGRGLGPGCVARDPGFRGPGPGTPAGATPLTQEGSAHSADPPPHDE
jgi:hypothetical protein